MSEWQRRKKETEWSERGREDYSDAPEPVYRDGSVRNECWDPGAYQRKRPEKAEEDD